MDEFYECNETNVDKGKRGKAHRPKSSSSHSSSGTNELPPILEPESSPTYNRRTPSAQREKSDGLFYVKSGCDTDTINSEDIVDDDISETNNDSPRSNGGRALPRTRMPSAATSTHTSDSSSIWAKFKKGFGKNKNQDQQFTQNAHKPEVDPDRYNKDAQERRVRTIMQMMKKTDELAEKEYYRFQEHKGRERKQREIEESRMEERLFKQAARGQLQCESHQKTLYSLNHLLKMERKHDDSMITSICDIVLQKPEMRSELMAYVRQEHATVQKMLDSAAKENQSETLTKLQRAMTDLKQKSDVQLEEENDESPDEQEMKTPEHQDQSIPPKEKRKKKKKKSEKDQDDTRRSSKRHKKKYKRGKSDEPSQFDTKAKTPAYPTAENMINARCETDGNGANPPTGKIEDPELANYVKSLESTVDDKLRVLLDTHSNKTDVKMNGDLHERKMSKMGHV